MSRESPIEWCDSTVNPMMGCNGCELWAPDKNIRSCYAGALITHMKRAGRPGYPAAFDRPTIFPGRIEEACRWPDLTGTARPGKPWLDGLPRVVFLDDMGDTFTEDLDLLWLLPQIEAMEASPHLWLFLTKRPRRMLQFFQHLGRVPRNFWLGVSLIERPSFSPRVEAMHQIRRRFPGVLTWASWEPAYEPLPWLPSLAAAFDWLVMGGESDPVPPPAGVVVQQARPTHPSWFRDLALIAGDLCIARFLKQWGAWWPVYELSEKDTDRLYHPAPKRGPWATRRPRVPTTILLPSGEQVDSYPQGATGGGGSMMMKAGQRRNLPVTLDGEELREMPRGVARETPAEQRP